MSIKFEIIFKFYYVNYKNHKMLNFSRPGAGREMASARIPRASPIQRSVSSTTTGTRGIRRDASLLVWTMASRPTARSVRLAAHVLTICFVCSSLRPFHF